MSESAASVWQATSVRVLHQGVFRVEEHDIRTPDGRAFAMPVLRCPADCAVVCPVFEDGTVMLVRQHRYVLDRETLELPSGGIDEGETPAQAGARELYEEAGVVVGDMVALGAFPSVGAIGDQYAHHFLAAGCRIDPEAPVCPDCRPVRLPINEALNIDGMPSNAALGLLLAARHLGV